VERLDRVRRTGNEPLGILVRLEVGEHPVGERPPVAAARPSDADAEAQEVLRAELLGGGAKPVVAREPAAPARLQPPDVEIALVVDDQDRVRLDLEELGRGLDRTPGLVHVRVRGEQRHAMRVDPHLGEAAVELRAPRAVVAPRELLHDHVADVVAVACVLAPGVPEPDDEQVEGRRAFAPSPGQAHGSYPSASDSSPPPSAGSASAAASGASPSTASSAPSTGSSRASWTLAMTISSGSSRSRTPSGTVTCERRRLSPTPRTETSASSPCGTSSGSA